MNTVYFPFTVLPEIALQDLEACFSGVTLLQACRPELPEAMARYAAGGFLTVHPVMPEKAARVFEAWNAFQDFAEMHGFRGDLRTRFFAGLESPGKIGGEYAASQIATFLKKSATKPVEQAPEDPAFPAALFLHMAQQYDLRNLEVDEALRSMEDGEKVLVRSLSGEPPPPSDRNALSEEWPETHRILERLTAWVRILLRVQNAVDFHVPRIWVTHSKPAGDHLLEMTPSSVQTEHLTVFPPARPHADIGGGEKAAFREGLQRLLSGQDSPPPENPPGWTHAFQGPRPLSIHCFTVRESPALFFGRAAGLATLPESASTSGSATTAVFLSPGASETAPGKGAQKKIE